MAQAPGRTYPLTTEPGRTGAFNDDIRTTPPTQYGTQNGQTVNVYGANYEGAIEEGERSGYLLDSAASIAATIPGAAVFVDRDRSGGGHPEARIYVGIPTPQGVQVLMQMSTTGNQIVPIAPGAPGFQPPRS